MHENLTKLFYLTFTVPLECDVLVNEIKPFQIQVVKMKTSQNSGRSEKRKTTCQNVQSFFGGKLCTVWRRENVSITN